MTWEDIFKKVMVMLDEAESTSLQTNIADYKNKIYECADSCQREIAVFVSYIVKRRMIECVDGEICLPDDCYEVLSLIDEDNKKVPFIDNGDRTLSVEDGEYIMKYNAFPKRVTEELLKEHPDISEEAHEALVYGICAGLCINDEPELYSTYMARYNGLIDTIIVRRNQYPKISVHGGIRL